MDQKLNVLSQAKKANKTNLNFKYSISSILKNIYEAFKSLKISAKEKLEIKNLIFSKSSSIAKILEELKNPNSFNVHLNTLKKIVKSSQTQIEEKTSKSRFTLSLNSLSTKKKNLKIKVFEESNLTIEALNHSLLMDSNESIILIEKTNQNLFSDEEDENLSTPLGFELFNLSTKSSSPLNKRQMINNENNLPTKIFNHFTDQQLIARQHEKNI